MEKIIRKILKESDFDWIKNIPSRFEVLEPIKNRNPRNMWRLKWYNGHGEDSSTWAGNWSNFSNDHAGLEKLIWLVDILQYKDKTHEAHIPIYELAKKVGEGEEWPLGGYIEGYNRELSEDSYDLDERVDLANEWLYQLLSDFGLIPYDDYTGETATIEKWELRYFDKYGVEHTVKINK